MLTTVENRLLIGTEEVSRFLLRWYGSAGGPSAGAAAPAGLSVPPELLEWHAAAARAGTPVTFQDDPIALDDLAVNSGGMLPFWVENQRAFSWAVDPSDAGRRVFFREYGSADWRPAGEDLTTFLRHCTMREAIIGAEKKFTVFLTEPHPGDAFSALDFPPLASEEPETTMWSSTDALARVTVPPVGYEQPGEQLWMVTVAVARDTSIEKYASRFGLDISDEITAPPVDLPGEAPPF
jgi:hypothetical protein